MFSVYFLSIYQRDETGLIKLRISSDTCPVHKQYQDLSVLSLLENYYIYAYPLQWLLILKFENC